MENHVLPVHMKTVLQVLVRCPAYAVSCDGRLVPDVGRQWAQNLLFLWLRPKVTGNLIWVSVEDTKVEIAAEHQ